MHNKESKIIEIENGLREEYIVKGDKLNSINNLMDSTNTPGVSITIINNFEVEWSKEYGVVDKETQKQVDKNSIFQAASISKPVTALAVMKLAQDGIVDLDEDVNTYLKSWKVPNNEFTKDNKVTLRNLTSHTAGVTVHGFAGYEIEKEIPTVLQILNGEKPSNSDKITVDISPNTKFRYSGGGYTIIQQLMVDLLGKSFEEIMKELILEPLGMKNSFFSKCPLSEEQSLNATTAYESNGKELPGKRHVYPEMAAAGLWTTSKDLAKFVLEIQRTLKGECSNIISKDYMEIMTAPILHGDFNIGLRNLKIGNENLLNHSGGNEGYRCNMIFHKEKGYGVIVMTNSDGGYEISMPIFRSAAHAYDWENLLNPEYKKEYLPEDKIQFFTNTYKMGTYKTVKIFSENNKLFHKYMCEKESKELEYIGNNTFLDKERTIKIEYREVDEKFYVNGSEIEPLKHGEKVPSKYVEENDLENAVKLYRELVINDDKIKNTLENDLTDIGYECIWRDNTESAIKFFKTNSILFPHSFNVWEGLGYAYFINEQYDLAIESMNESLKYNPDNTWAVEIISKSEKNRQVD